MSSLQSLDRALDMLSLIHENGGKISVSSISEIMNLHRSTVHRTLSTMYQKGFLSKNPKTGLYIIGPKALALGFSSANNIPVADVARPYMAFLAEKYNNSISLSVIEGADVFIINHHSGFYTTTFYSLCEDHIVSEVYHPAIAQCMLAFNCKLESSVSAIQIYFNKVSNNRFKDSIFSNVDELVAHLHKIKDAGYSYEPVDHKTDELCYCVPIYYNGKAMATLSINGHSTHLQRFPKHEIIDDFLSISTTISDLLCEH